MFFLFSILSFFGMTLAIYSGSPYFGALGLVLVSISACGLSSYFGLSFMGLVLVLTYLGGMIVVFMYSSALASDKYPSVGGWGGTFLVFLVVIYYFFLDFFLLSSSSFLEKGRFFLYKDSVMYKEGGSWFLNSFLESLDWGSCGLLYTFFFILLFLVALVLLISLVLVLVVSFGSYKKSLRALK